VRRVSTTDKGLEAQLNMALGEVEARLGQIEGGPVAGGRVLAEVKLIAGATTALQHGLGRPARGWWVVRARPSAVTLWLVVEDNNPRPAEQLVLRSGCDADVVVDVYVF
jgi:hypothetical protein